MKLLRFLGGSLTCLREFPEDARQDAGYQLDKVQRGEQPDDFKPMPSIGKGVAERFACGTTRAAQGRANVAGARMRRSDGTYRVIYTARIADAVYALHAFQKKTQATSKRDIELAKSRYTELMRGEK